MLLELAWNTAVPALMLVLADAGVGVRMNLHTVGPCSTRYLTLRSSKASLRLEVDLVYDPSYQCPVTAMRVFVSANGGESLVYGQEVLETMGVVGYNLQPHPYTSAPAFLLHPCRVNEVYMEATKGTLLPLYSLIWFVQVYCQLLGIAIPMSALP